MSGRVIFDTDPGIDDATAPFFLLRSHEPELIVVGGAATVPANGTLLAEANFHSDPEAASMRSTRALSGPSAGTWRSRRPARAHPGWY